MIGDDGKEFLPFGVVLKKMNYIPLAVPLTGLELQRKILIPGYRLIPYLSSNIPENEIVLLDETGKEIPQLKCAFSLEDVFELYRYSNEKHFPDDIKINEWLPGKSSLALIAWDILRLRTGKGRAEDLLVELVDYETGVFCVKPYSRLEQKRNLLKVRRLNIALEEILVELGQDHHFASLGLEKQLLKAFYHLPVDILDVPAFSLRYFLESLSKLSVVGCEWGAPRFISSGKFQRYEYTLETASRQSRGKCDNLDNIFQDLDLPFNCIEFKAILRNTLIRNTLNMEELVDLLFGGKGDLFFNRRQEEIFYQLLRRQMRAMYIEIESPEPKAITDLREQTVQVKLSLIRILKYLEAHDIELSELPLELLDLVIELDGFSLDSLTFLEETEGPTNLKRVRDLQLAHKIIKPKLASLEGEVYHGLSFY